MEKIVESMDRRFRYLPKLQKKPTIPFPAPPTKVNIDVKIEHLTDLVNVIRTYGPQWRADTEYNIDLSTLMRIQSELECLDAMIGLPKFKRAVLDQLLYFLQNLHVDSHDSDFLHTILCGPPGTGKTEIAKILGKLYAKLGILKNGTFKKVTRSDLIGGYLGQTAIKTSKVIQESLGGCLFIDEAYSLATRESTQNDSYSKECLDTLCEALSDHKSDLMVILAGYETELHETIFRANRGLESRFLWRFVLDDYNAVELYEMFKKKVCDNRWHLADDFPEVPWFEKRKANFPNFGRDMELLFSYTKCCHSRRVYGLSSVLRKRLTVLDLTRGYEMLLANRREKESYQIPGFYV